MKLKIMSFLLTLMLLLTFALETVSVEASNSTFSILPAVKYAAAGNILTSRLMAYSITDMINWTARIEWNATIFDLAGPPIFCLPEPPVGIFDYANGSGWLNMTQALDYGVTFDVGPLAIFYLRAKINPPTYVAGGTPINITYAVYYDSYGNPTTPEVWNATVYRVQQGVTTIEWLTAWTTVSEVQYWDNCIAEFQEENPNINVVMTCVEFANLYNAIMIKHPAGQDPDLMHIPAMWVPIFVARAIDMLSAPPDDIQEDVRAKWTEASTNETTFHNTIWGYPTQYNNWALVWNKKIFEDVGLNASKPPTTWGKPSVGEGELEQMALQCTTHNESGMINRTGFYPVFPECPEECRYQFMSLLWSNNGEYVDLDEGEAEFNNKEGVEVLKLYEWSRNNTWDPSAPPYIWWDAWKCPYEIAIMVLPSWMHYIKDVMGYVNATNPGNFTSETLGIAPIPVGPHGTEPVSIVDSWVSVVTRAAETRYDYVGGPTHAEAAWTFLKWINQPKEHAAPYGAQPNATNVSRMGDFLIYDEMIPSRLSDQANSPILTTDFWFKDFIDIGNEYGRADTCFRTDKKVQDIVFSMIENVTNAVEDPQTAADVAASAVTDFLPIPGDINEDGVVDIFDIAPIAVIFAAIPEDPNWNPFADLVHDNIIDIFDIAVVAVNFGRYNKSYDP